MGYLPTRKKMLIIRKKKKTKKRKLIKSEKFKEPNRNSKGFWIKLRKFHYKMEN